jgi:hypothetical protein
MWTIKEWSPATSCHDSWLVVPAASCGMGRQAATVVVPGFFVVAPAICPPFQQRPTSAVPGVVPAHPQPTCIISLSMTLQQCDFEKVYSQKVKKKDF